MGPFGPFRTLFKGESTLVSEVQEARDLGTARKAPLSAEIALGGS